MARIDLSRSPYNDTYDAAKQYVQLLAVPGRVAQASEFTTLQTIIRSIIKSIGDSILKNGNIIEGCQVIVNGEQVTVTAGKVYVDGIVMNVEETKVAINGTGAETIGVKLMEVIVDENSDPMLRDQAQGYDNYNQPGCHRLKRYLEVVANDAEAATIATLIDGALAVETYAPEYDKLTQTLADRTYEESGSYIVEGLKIRIEDVDTQSYNVVVEKGLAYVEGYRVKIPSSRKILVNKSLDYSLVPNARDRMTSSSEYLLDNNPYVKSITKVVGEVSVKENPPAISSNLDEVRLENAPVLRIVSVKQGSTTYKVGSSMNEGDCYLRRDGTNYYLKWNGTENYPKGSYEVTYIYEKVFEGTVDYELKEIDSAHYLSWIDGGSRPLLDTYFEVSYEQYLARKDIVYMDKLGNIEVLSGVSAEDGYAEYPEVPMHRLVLANISNPPNGTVGIMNSNNPVQVSNIGLKRFTMNDIQNIVNRVQTLEYDQAVMSLNDDARQTESMGEKKGIWTDPLIDLSKIDFYYNLSEGNPLDTSKPIYDMALDLVGNICYLPIVSNINSTSLLSTGSSVNRYGRLVSLAVKEKDRAILEQTHATKTFLINPYSMFPQMPEVSVDPAVDNWIDTEIIEVPMSINRSEIVAMSARTIDTTEDRFRNNSNYASQTRTSIRDTSIGTRTESYSTDSIISEGAVTYIRRRTLTVEGHNFFPGLDNIRCYFDGIPVALDVISGSAGTNAGTIRPDGTGYFKATFMIPENVLTGVREISLKPDPDPVTGEAIKVDGFITEGFTLYIAEGISRRVERTVTTVNTVLLERVTTNEIVSVYVDPVGQTFILDKMSLIKGVEVYFATKPSVNTPVTCEIREVLNGNITSTVYAHKTLSKDAVTADENARLGTKFYFDDPVLLEENKEYAFVLRSTSDAYSVWVSELGGIDKVTGDTVLKNSYMSGVMMSSSNNSSWTSHQTMDMKFKLLEDVYEDVSNIVFEDITVSEAARLYLTADSALPADTSIDWTYAIHNEAGVSSFKSITPYNIVLLQGLYNKVSLRATLKKSQKHNLSPLLALETVSLIDSHYDTSGCYISENIPGAEFNNIQVVLDTYEPAGTDISVSISTDGGKTIEHVLKSSNAGKVLDYGWREITFVGEVGPATQCKVFIYAKSDSKYKTPAFRRVKVIKS